MNTSDSSVIGNIEQNFSELRSGLTYIDDKNDLAITDVKDELMVSDQHAILNMLSGNQKFIKELISKETMKEMQELFSRWGVILSYEEIDTFLEMIKYSATKKELDDELLDKAVGGVFDNPAIYTLAGETGRVVNELSEKEINPHWLLGL